MRSRSSSATRTDRRSAILIAGSRYSRRAHFFRVGKQVYILCSWKGAGFSESGTAGALNIVSVLNTTSVKNSTFQKIATAPAATSRHSINSRGKTRAPTTIPRARRMAANFAKLPELLLRL